GWGWEEAACYSPAALGGEARTRALAPLSRLCGSRAGGEGGFVCVSFRSARGGPPTPEWNETQTNPPSPPAPPALRERGGRRPAAQGLLVQPQLLGEANLQAVALAHRLDGGPAQR